MTGQDLTIYKEMVQAACQEWQDTLSEGQMNVAFHEAGHAVMTYVQGLPIGRAYIKEEGEAGEWRGAAGTGAYSDEDLASEILVDLAGAGANAMIEGCSLSECLSNHPERYADDLSHATHCAGELYRRLLLTGDGDWAQHWTEVNPERVIEVLREHRPAVVKVAIALMTFGECSESLLEALIRDTEGPGGRLPKEPKQ